MKKITLLLILLFLINSVSSQITSTKIGKSEELKITKPYDSIKNFLGKDVYKYLNQDLYLIERFASLRSYGYRGFLTTIKQLDTDKLTIDEMFKSLKPGANVYKCCDKFNSKYEDLKGKYFNVVNIHKHPMADFYPEQYYLELIEKESKDILFYKYDSKFELTFPFLVVGFYEKQKKKFVGNEFVFRDQTLSYSSDGIGLNILTGKPFTIKTGEKWKCIDLTIEENYYKLVFIFESNTGLQVAIGYQENFKEYYRALTLKEAAKLKIKYGSGNFSKILKGKVKIGMTKEMCKLSWGKPKDINKTISSGINSEQWVYNDNYLYFNGDKLTTIQ